jgi:hypothetical protein
VFCPRRHSHLQSRCPRILYYIAAALRSYLYHTLLASLLPRGLCTSLNRCQMSKETYYSVKRDLLQCQKRPTTVSKETYYSVKRDLLPRGLCTSLNHALSGEPLSDVKRDLLVSKETYYSVKRDLLQCQKRPTTVSKETYYSVKREAVVRCTHRHVDGYRWRATLCPRILYHIRHSD